MDSFEFNKIAGAALAALLLMFGSRTLLDVVAAEHKPEKAGWALPITEGPASPGPAAPAAEFKVADVLGLLPKASAEGGKDVFKRCLQCHTIDKGGKNLVGPNLYGVVNRKVAVHEGFNFSEAMKKHGGDWSWDKLAEYLHDPKAAAPGNRMAFAGIKDNAELADLLAYIGKQSDAPPAMPK
ncbi:MAG: cytochrome c family protein [Hyphomicrobiaceae bacterium]|nr:cytochrome c family protein [Hyphomicrobiaceae bacterium]